MRIDPRTWVAAATTLGAKPGAAGRTRFAVEDEERSVGGPTQARSSAPLATLDAILALQGEHEDPRERRRRSAGRGQNLLDALDELKVALLGGRVSAHDLGRIAARLKEIEASGDPGLDAVLAQIDLRAKVELAKLGRTDLI